MVEEQGNLPWSEAVHYHDDDSSYHGHSSSSCSQVEGVIEGRLKHARDFQRRVILDDNAVGKGSKAKHGSHQKHEVGSIADVENED